MLTWTLIKIVELKPNNDYMSNEGVLYKFVDAIDLLVCSRSHAKWDNAIGAL